jgi:hypothetical protein
MRIRNAPWIVRAIQLSVPFVRSRWLSAVIVLLVCGTTQVRATSQAEWTDYREAQRHLIVIRPRGEPVKPIIKRREVSPGQWEYKVEQMKTFGATAEEQTKNYEKYLEPIVDAAAKAGRVMFFIHGGMNFVSGSTKRAAELVGKDQKCSDYDLSAQGYPIFICWDSPPTGYGEQLAWVRAGKTERYGETATHKTYALLTLPFHLLADVGRGLARFPAELSQFAANDLYAIEPNRFGDFQKMSAEVEYLRSEVSSGTDHVQVSCVPTLPTTPGRYLADLQTALLFPIRTLTLPVIDAIGVGAWDNMLRHTETMFDRTDTGKKRHPTPVEWAVKQDQTGAIAMFFAKLQEKTGSRCQITLITHSMGAIVGNRIIVSYPKLDFRNIVYMAAACSVHEFESSVVPYMAMAEHSSTRFYNLSLHPRCEAGEIALSPGRFSFDLAPRGSLPVWIDNIFAKPPSEGQRRLGIFQNAVLASHNIPQGQRSKYTLKHFGFGNRNRVNGRILNPQHHADFSDAPYWQSCFWKLDDSPSACMQTPAKLRSNKVKAN